MAIKKIKVASVWVNEEKEITSKKDGKVYKVVKVSVKVADDCKDYAGKYINISIFGDEKRTATSKAEYFKTESTEKEILINVDEREYTNKEGLQAISLEGKQLSKKEKEVAEQFLK